MKTIINVNPKPTITIWVLSAPKIYLKKVKSSSKHQLRIRLNWNSTVLKAEQFWRIFRFKHKNRKIKKTLNSIFETIIFKQPIQITKFIFLIKSIPIPKEANTHWNFRKENQWRFRYVKYKFKSAKMEWKYWKKNDIGR